MGKLTERDEEIECPVARRCDGHTLRAVSAGVDFSDNCPNNRSPGHSEACNEKTSECDHRIANALA